MSGKGRLSALIHVFSRLETARWGGCIPVVSKDHQNTTCEPTWILKVQNGTEEFLILIFWLYFALQQRL